jgi:hypothetical protein
MAAEFRNKADAQTKCKFLTAIKDMYMQQNGKTKTKAISRVTATAEWRHLQTDLVMSVIII